MKRALLLLVFITGSLAGFSTTPPACVVMPRTVASVSAEWNNFRPNCLYYQRAGIPDWNAVGVNVGLRRYERARWSLQPRVGFTYGAITFENLQENVELSAGGTGNYHARSRRMSYFGGVQAGRVFGSRQLFSIEIPIYAAFRSIGHEGYFLDDENTRIPVDLDGANPYNGKFGSKTQFGFKSGMEFVFLPKKKVSFYTRFNFTYFAKKDVYNVAETELDSNGDINVPFESVKATGNYGWAAGIRFNLIRF